MAGPPFPLSLFPFPAFASPISAFPFPIPLVTFPLFPWSFSMALSRSFDPFSPFPFIWSLTPLACPFSLSLSPYSCRLSPCLFAFFRFPFPFPFPVSLSFFPFSTFLFPMIFLPFFRSCFFFPSDPGPMRLPISLSFPHSAVPWCRFCPR